MELNDKIKQLEEKTRISFTMREEVRASHLFTKYWDKIPEELQEEIRVPSWALKDEDFQVEFLSNNKDEWKKVYSSLRALGWNRLSFYPPTENYKGIAYLFEQDGIKLYLKIYFVNCEVKQTGTKMVEQPVYEINCPGTIEDIDPPKAEDAPEAPPVFEEEED